ncbi:hypothetical protein OSTOST_03769 [Ostertagia ostertagi]
MSLVCLPGEDLSTRIPKENTKIIGYGIGRDPNSDILVARQPGIFKHEGEKCWISVHSKSDFYKLEIGTPENATISFLAFEGATKRNRPDLKIGDVVYAQVMDEFAHADVELTCVDAVSRARGLGVLSGGFLFKVSCNLARRLLSSHSQLLKLLGKDYKFEITVGLNGRVWLKGAVLV